MTWPSGPRSGRTSITSRIHGSLSIEIHSAFGNPPASSMICRIVFTRSSPTAAPRHTGRTLPVRCFLCTALDDRGSASPGTVLSLAHPAKVHDRVLRRPRSSSSHRPQTHNLPGSSQRGAPILEGTVHGGAAKPRTVSFAVSACGSPDRHEAADAGLETRVRPLGLTRQTDPAWARVPFVSLRYYAIAPAGFDIAIGS